MKIYFMMPGVLKCDLYCLGTKYTKYIEFQLLIFFLKWQNSQNFNNFNREKKVDHTFEIAPKWILGVKC